MEEEGEPDKKRRKKEKNVLNGLEDSAIANADAFVAATTVAGAATLVAGAVNVRNDGSAGGCRTYFLCFFPHLFPPSLSLAFW